MKNITIRFYFPSIQIFASDKNRIEKLVFLKYPKLIKMTLRARLFADNHFTVDKMINTYKKLINTIY